jgi:MAF protein
MIPNLILASNSPRRKELLALSGQNYRVVPADVDESTAAGEDPRDYVTRLSKEKAKVTAGKLNEPALILAADTTVVFRGEILGKPADAKDAVRILKLLRNETHKVYTAIVILRVPENEFLVDLAETDVPMRNYSDKEIHAYVASGDPLDKAGAYAIQHAGFHPVASMQGCYANVIGLPLCHLQRSLQKWGLSFENDLPIACQKHLAYECQVSAKILDWQL